MIELSTIEQSFKSSLFRHLRCPTVANTCLRSTNCIMLWERISVYSVELCYKLADNCMKLAVFSWVFAKSNIFNATFLEMKEWKAEKQALPPTALSLILSYYIIWLELLLKKAKKDEGLTCALIILRIFNVFEIFDMPCLEHIRSVS